jgi:hypothetical protein
MKKEKEEVAIEGVCQCPECEKRRQEHMESENMNFAILLALVPALAVTFFSSAGFF